MVLVIYSRPAIRKHHFLALKPLLKPAHPTPTSKQRTQLSNNIHSFQQNYPRQHPNPNPGAHPYPADLGMAQLIDWINASEELDRHLHRPHPPTSNQIQTTEETLPPLPDPPHQSSPHSTPSPLDPLLASSTFLQQVRVRMVELGSWPSRYRRIAREGRADLAGRRAEYVMLFNTLWLVVNDVILGRAVAVLLMANSHRLARGLEHFLTTYTVVYVKQALVWTNSYPVGLKLNDQLGQAFCSFASTAVDLWHVHVLKLAFEGLPRLVWTIGAASLCGNTFSLALASDFLTLATFHLWALYRLMTLLFNRHLVLLGVLYNIFRGQKFNLLRHRLEPATYPLDQLILGTILFTLAAFLLPTVLAFYAVLSSTRVSIVCIHGLIGTGLALLNHFPLFVLMLRLKDPARLPAGVAFVPDDLTHGPLFRLQTLPVGLPCIFADYIAIWVALTAHYSPRRLLHSLCLGEPIAPLSSRTRTQRGHAT